MEDLSIIIPVYNEEKAIAETVNYFRGLLEENPGIEIIFVDDGSKDKTPQILESIKLDQIKVITHKKNKGYGAAIKQGLKISSHEYIAITDADGSYPHEKISALFEKLLAEKADMAIGARVGKKVEIGIFRRFPKFVLRKLAEYLSEEEISDLNSGLRIVKKEMIMRSFKYLPKGFSFTTTLTLSLLANNHKIIYFPIDYYKRKGKSKIKPFRDTLNFFQLIIRTVMFFNPLKIFLPLSSFFIILSFVVLIVSYLKGRIMDITTILLFVTGLHLLAIGLLADLIDKRLSK
ncbi:MAG: glycosyltransferase family 2 protein [Candidatus Aminicenantes bacterium]|nr:MAG: glycosyltransferase family 2 protein [Candidatus Aminicenantes bacterium]